MPAGTSRFRFGEFEFDALMRQVRYRGKTTTLDPRARDIFLALLERSRSPHPESGRVVTYAEIDRLGGWAKGNSINRQTALSRLRKQLTKEFNDHWTTPPSNAESKVGDYLIRTVQRVGLEFCHDLSVEELDDSAATDAITNGPTPPTGSAITSASTAGNSNPSPPASPPIPAPEGEAAARHNLAFLPTPVYEREPADPFDGPDAVVRAPPVDYRVPFVAVGLLLAATSCVMAIALVRTTDRPWAWLALVGGPVAVGAAVDYAFLAGYTPRIRPYLARLDDDLHVTPLLALPGRAASWLHSFLLATGCARNRRGHWLRWAAFSVALTTAAGWIGAHRAHSVSPTTRPFLSYLHAYAVFLPVIYLAKLVFDYLAIVLSLAALKRIATAVEPFTPTLLLTATAAATGALALAGIASAMVALQLIDSGAGTFGSGHPLSMLVDSTTILIGIRSPDAILVSVPDSFIAEWLMICSAALTVCAPVATLMGLLGSLFVFKYSVVGLVRTARMDSRLSLGLRFGLAATVFSLALLGGHATLRLIAQTCGY